MGDFSSSVSTPSRILSFFGRLNYNLMERYLLTVTFRADGSSKFAPSNRWGYFPSVAAGWRISEEAFIKDNNIEILALTIPKGSATEVVQTAIRAGIKGIWNFAHIDLEVPDNVVVENVHLSESLMTLSYNITRLH